MLIFFGANKDDIGRYHVAEQVSPETAPIVALHPNIYLTTF